MKHYLYISIVFFLFAFSNSRENAKRESKLISPETSTFENQPKNAIFFDHNSRIDWSSVELKLDPKTRVYLISRFDEQFSFIKEDDFYKDKYDAMFHFLHLNNDGLIDVIFEGWSGGEPDISKFFYNTGDDFEFQFEALQYISQLEFNNGQLASFKSLDFGCCADYVNWENYYIVENDSLVLTLKRAKIDQTAPPEEYFENVKKFVVLNSPYHLRFEPKIINDDTYSPMMENSGNQVAEYEKGDIGLAYAEKTDSTGRVWWFVEMSEKEEIKNKIIYDEEPNKSRYLGWMSSRFLEELE